MNMVVESCGLMVQSHDCNPHDPCMGGGGVGACLSVCVSVCIEPDIASIFFSRAVRTSYCKGSRASGSNRSMWWP